MDEPADVSSQNRVGWHLLDGCAATRNRKVKEEACHPAGPRSTHSQAEPGVIGRPNLADQTRDG
jgi:hypothetical protein